MKARLTPSADRDVANILSDTKKLFGAQQVSKYAAVIDHGLELLCENPLRASSKAHDEYGAEIRSFPLRLASGKTAGASHVIYYLPVEDEVLVLRILAESMLPKWRIAKALKQN